MDEGVRGPQAGSISVTWDGETRSIDQVGTLSFGRSADLVIDEGNHFLHRVLGVFVFDGVWWLHNVGRYIPMFIHHQGTRSRVEVVPGSRAAVAQSPSCVVFEAGSERYELELVLEEQPAKAVESAAPTDTVRFAPLRLNEEQVLLVTAMAEPLLRGDPAWPAALPPNREVARRLGWTLTKFNRKLDYLCRRLAAQGVEGLQGDLGKHASNRRLRLVEHLVQQGSVTVDDLGLLTRKNPDSGPDDEDVESSR